MDKSEKTFSSFVETGASVLHEKAKEAPITDEQKKLLTEAINGFKAKLVEKHGQGWADLVSFLASVRIMVFMSRKEGKLDAAKLLAEVMGQAGYQMLKELTPEATEVERAKRLKEAMADTVALEDALHEVSNGSAFK